MSKPWFVKVNIHGHFQDQPLPNGKSLGIGVVIRNSRGLITRIYAGSLRIQERPKNELYAMFEGLIRAYLDENDFVELETDNVGSHWEWSNSTLVVVSKHRYVVQQIN